MSGAATWETRYSRERSARREAEAILETKSRELYQLNRSLQAARDNLEQQVAERTRALQEAVGKLQAEVRRRRAAEDELRRARDSALELSDLKSEFLARMSHEMRTPLNAVIGLTGLLLGSELDAEQARQLETVRSSGQMLLRLINDILDLSKIDANKLELEYAPVRLEGIIEQSISLVMLEAEKKGIDFELKKQPFLPDEVVVDGGRVQQLLLNLLSNAVKYSDRGTVKVSVRLDEPGPGAAAPRELLAAGGVDAGDVRLLTLSVEDEGAGIRAEDLERLFEPFTQLETATVGSSGLGLAICRRLCRMMGGEVAVESAPGEGSTFTVGVLCALPGAAVAKAAPAAAEETTTYHSTTETGAWLITGHLDERAMAERAGMAHAKPLSILLADDYEVNRMVQHAQLEQLGYRADAVANGEEVLRALHARPYDVVLMDIRMPVMDGVQATRRIRQRTDGPQPFIVAVTASALADDRERFRQAGMDAYVAKPVDMGELIAVLEQAWESRRREPAAFGPEDMLELCPVALDLDGLYSRLGPAADGLLARVIPVYLRELPAREAGLREAHEAGDAEAFTRLCHGLKGSSRSIGAAELADACDAHEKRGHAGHLPSRPELDELLDLARRTARALERKLAELGAGAAH